MNLLLFAVCERTNIIARSGGKRVTHELGSQIASRWRESAPLTPFPGGRWRDGSEKTTLVANHRLPPKSLLPRRLSCRSMTVVVIL